MSSRIYREAAEYVHDNAVVGCFAIRRAANGNGFRESELADNVIAKFAAYYMPFGANHNQRWWDDVCGNDHQERILALCFMAAISEADNG